MQTPTPDLPLPVIRGTHCADLDADAVPPVPRTTARHRGASSGRRVLVRQSELAASPRVPAHGAQRTH